MSEPVLRPNSRSNAGWRRWRRCCWPRHRRRSGPACCRPASGRTTARWRRRRGRRSQVRETLRWPRRWANFSPLYSCSKDSHRNARANLRLLGQPDTFLASARRTDLAVAADARARAIARNAAREAARAVAAAEGSAGDVAVLMGLGRIVALHLPTPPLYTGITNTFGASFL
jgi:hypothetical protein